MKKMAENYRALSLMSQNLKQALCYIFLYYGLLIYLLATHDYRVYVQIQGLLI